MDELAFLRKENNILKQKQWAKKDDNRKSRYFFLVDTKIKPKDAAEEKRLTDYLDETMRDFKEDVGDLITFNKPGHSWNSDYIDNVKTRYVVEKGPGKLKKNGELGKSGGTMHLHADLNISHKSNITLKHEDLKQYFENKLQYHTGVKPFVSKPRLVHENQIEEYMSKSYYNLNWNKVD